jgi:nucleoid DNA-binding protein
MSTNDSPKPMSKTEVVAALADSTGLTKQQVNTLFDQLGQLIAKNLGENAPGMFTVPGLMRIRVTRKPATPERKGINPFTKQETVFKAKPARNVIKIQPLKGLKDMV